MKNPLLILSAFFFLSFLFSGCSGNKKAEDIQVSELETACDHVDAMVICLEELKDVLGDKDRVDLNKDEEQQLEKLIEKLDDITEHVKSLNFDKSEIKECASADKLDTLMHEIDRHM